MSFTLCRSICTPIEHVWFEIIFLSNDKHSGAILHCLQGYFYILWESFVVMYPGKWTFLMPGVCRYEHQIAFLSISVLLMTPLSVTNSLFAKLLHCALPHRFPSWRHFTDGAILSASFFLCAYWTVSWKEGSLTTTLLPVQKCPQCQFGKVEGQFPMDYAKFVLQHF